MSKKNLVECIITISGERIQGCGEDSVFAAYCEPVGVLSVFDGCGGIGAKKYPSQDNRTGAYLASRAARSAAESWFGEISDFDKADVKRLSEELKQRFKFELSRLSENESMMKGSLVKEFPTTASLILFKQEKKKVLTGYIWAGDSRGYVFEPEGIIQLTRDDIVGGGDAYVNLREDARLSNFVSANGDFDLSLRVAEIEAPSMLVCATDGCFGYFKTPMEFEYMLLETLDKAHNYAMWKTLISQRLKAVSGDDFSMNICLIGCNGIEGAKKIFKKRKKQLLKNYISKSETADEEKLKNLWNEYKEEYYG